MAKLLKYFVLLIPVILFAGVCVVVFGQQDVNKHNKHQEIYREIESATSSFISKTNVTFLYIDQLLKRIIDAQQTNLLFGSNLRQNVRHNMHLISKENNIIDAIIITNSEGKIDSLYSAKNPNFTLPPGSMYAIAALYKHHLKEGKNNINFFVHVLRKKQSDNNKNVDLIVGRRIYNIDGSFKGVAAIVVKGDVILDINRDINLSLPSKIGILLDEDEVIIGKDNLELKNFIPTNILNKKNIEDDNKILKSKFANFKNIHLVKGNENGNEIIYAISQVKPWPLSLAIIVDYKEKELNNNLVYKYLFVIFIFIFLAILEFAILKLDLVKRLLRISLKGKVKIYGVNENIKTPEIITQESEIKTYPKVEESKILNFYQENKLQFLAPSKAILALSNLALEEEFGVLSDEQKKRILDIRYCASKIILASDNLDLYAKIISGESIEKIQKEFSTDYLINNILQNNEKFIKNKRINLIYDNEKEFELNLDFNKLKFILENIFKFILDNTSIAGSVEIVILPYNSKGVVFNINGLGVNLKQDIYNLLLNPFEFKLKEENIDYNIYRLNFALIHEYLKIINGNLKINRKSDVGCGFEICIKL